MFVFPGMEIASYLIDKASSITVIGSSEMPYQNTLGREIGKVTMMVREKEKYRPELYLREAFLKFQYFRIWTLLVSQMLSEKNVKFYMNDGVTEVRGADGKVCWEITHCKDQIQTRGV